MVPPSIYFASGFMYSVLIPIYLTNGCIMTRIMAVSWPESCFISYTQKTLSKYTGAVRRDMTWSYQHYFLYVRLRRTKDHPLSTTCKSLHFLRPSLHITTTPIMLKITKVVHSGICPWECWGCIYSIGPQHQQLPRYAPGSLTLPNCQNWLPEQILSFGTSQSNGTSQICIPAFWHSFHILWTQIECCIHTWAPFY